MDKDTKELVCRHIEVYIIKYPTAFPSSLLELKVTVNLARSPPYFAPVPHIQQEQMHQHWLLCCLCQEDFWFWPQQVCLWSQVSRHEILRRRCRHVCVNKLLVLRKIYLEITGLTRNVTILR